MVEYNTINAKLTNLQLNKSKSTVKSIEGITLRFGSKNFNKEELPYELFLTQKQITKLRNSINNNISTDIKLSKAQIKKIIMSGIGLGSNIMRFLPKLIKTAASILKNVGLPLGLSAAMSGIDKKIDGYVNKSGTTVKFSNEEINNMVNIFTALEDPDVLMKGVSKTLKNDAQKGSALPLIPMLLGILGVSLLELTRGLFRAGGKCDCGQELYRAGE